MYVGTVLVVGDQLGADRWRLEAVFFHCFVVYRVCDRYVSRLATSWLASSSSPL